MGDIYYLFEITEHICLQLDYFNSLDVSHALSITLIAIRQKLQSSFNLSLMSFP